MTNNMIQAQHLQNGDRFETRDGTEHVVLMNRELPMTGRRRIMTTEGRVIIERDEATFHLLTRD